MLEALKTKSTIDLNARLCEIVPIIDLLVGVWDNPELSAAMVLRFKIADEKFESGVIDILQDCCLDTLRQFIHDFCTHLCAEKLCIEALLAKRNAVAL